MSTNGILLRLVDLDSHQGAVWFDRPGKRAGNLGLVEGSVGTDLSHDGPRAVTDAWGLRVTSLGIIDSEA